MAKKEIRYGIGFDVDKTGLQQLKAELSKLNSYTLDDILKINTSATQKDLNELRATIAVIDNALNESYSLKLDSSNILLFKKHLQDSGLTLEQVRAQLVGMGTDGQVAYNTLLSEILTTNNQLKESSKLLDSMWNTLGNTIKWSVASGAINSVTGAIKEAWGFSKSLNASLNDIRIVTGKSAQEMEKFAKKANAAAKSLGASTTDYTNASLIYYQQGLKDEDVQARTEVTVKAANVTGQSAAEVSEQLTAVWNGYKVVAEEAELYVDKLAAVAASTAADLEELSDGMSKVASAAFTMGVDIDQLSAQLATIVSVTRQDASLVGTALKTIYARMGDLKVSGIDEFGTSLGDVSGQLRQMGINVLDQEGNLRDMGAVIEEVAKKWGTWTDAQQQAAAVAIAGKRQYNNLIALFENWDMYESSLSISQNSEGTLQAQQDVYMEGLEAKLQQFQTTKEKLFDEMFDDESMGTFIGLLSKVVDYFAETVRAVGGGGQALLNFGAIAATVFKDKIADNIERGINNLTRFKTNSEIIKEEMAIINSELNNSIQNGNQNEIEGLKVTVKLKEDQLTYARYLNQEYKDAWDNQIKERAEAENRLALAKEELNTYENQREKLQEMLNARNKMETRPLRVGDIMTKGEAREKGLNAGQFVGGETRDLPAFGAKEFDIATEAGREIALQGIEAQLKQLKEDSKNIDIIETIYKDDTIQGNALLAGADEYTEDLKSFDKTFKGNDEDKAVVSEARKELAKSTDEYRLALEAVAAAEEKLAQAMEKGEGIAQATVERDKELQEANLKYSDLKVKLTNAVEAHSQAVSKETKILKNAQEEINKASKTHQNLTNKIKSAESAVKSLQQKYNAMLRDLKKRIVIKSFTAIGTGALAAATSVGNLVNMFKQLQSDDLSTFDKLMLVFQNMVITGPQFYKGLRDISKGLTDLANRSKLATEATEKQMGAQIKAAQENAAAATQEQAQEAALTATKTGSTVATKLQDEAQEDLNEERAKGILLAQGAEDADKQGSSAALLNAAATGKETDKINQNSVALQVNTKKTLANKTAKAGLVGLVVAATAATIALTVALVMHFSKQESGLKKAKKELKEEQETLEALSKAYKAQTEELNNINNSFDELAKKQKVLDDLIVGTEEWTKAVQDNNNAVLDLLDSYPELAKYISKDANGVLAIKEEGEIALKEAQQSKVNKAYAATLSQQASVLEAKNKVKILSSDFAIRDNWSGLDTNQIAKLEEVFLTANSGDGTKEAFEQALQEGNLLTLSDEVADALAGEDYVDALWENKEAISQQIAEINANTMAIDAMKEAYVAATFADNKSREEAENVAAWDSLMAAYIEEEKGKLDKEDYKNYKGINKTNIDSEDMWLAEESLGLEHGQLSKDGKRSYSYYVNGEKITLKADEIAERMVEYQATKNAEARAANATEIVNFLSDIDPSITNIIGGKEVAALDSSSYTKTTLANLKYEEVKDQLEQEFGEKWWSTLGYKSEKEYKEAFDRSISQAGLNIENIVKGTAGDGMTTKDVSKGGVFAEATADELKNISNGLNQAFKTGGRDGLNALKTYLTEFSDDPEVQSKISSIASSIDWSGFNAANEFVAALEAAGIPIDKTNAAFNALLESIEASSNTVGVMAHQFKQIRTTVSELSKILNDLSTGEIISDEEYKKILQFNPDAKEFFMLTADGMKFIGESAKELKKDTLASFENISQVKEDFEGINTTSKEIQDKDVKIKINASGQNNAIALTDLFEQFGPDNIMRLINAQDGNISLDQINEYINLVKNQNVDTSSYDYKVASEGLKSALSNVQLSINDSQAGLFSSDMAEESFVTMYTNSFEEAKEAFDEGLISEDTLNKAAKLYKNELAKELGFTGDWAKAFSYDEVAKMISLTRQLEQDHFVEINKELDLANSLMDRLFGSERLSQMQEIVELSKDKAIIAANRENWSLELFRSAAQGYLSNTDFNFEDATNEDILKKLYDISLSEIDEETRDGVLAVIDLYSQASDAATEAAESQWAIIDAQIEAYRYQKESVKELLEWSHKLADFNSKFAEGNVWDLFGEDSAIDIIKNAERVFKEQKELFAVNIDYAKEMDEESTGNPYSSYDQNGNVLFNSAQFKADWQEDIESAMQNLEEMQSSLQQMYDGLLQAEADLLALYDQEVEKLSNINSLLKGSADLHQLVNKKSKDGFTNYEEQLKGYYSDITDNASKSYSLALAKLKDVELQVYNVNNIDGISEEIQQTLYKNLSDASQEVLDAATVWMEAFSQEFEISLTNAIDSAIITATKLDLAAISEEWSNFQAAEDRYLDEVNATYGIDKFNRAVQKSIDETDNQAAQKKLMDLRTAQEEKLNSILKERGKLSQYELDRANAEYELTLKQIALEEAQQTANKMKLTRDAMGNYSYQYIQDQDAIAKAEEEFAEAENKLYNLSKDRNSSLVSDYYSLMSTANSSIAEAVAAGDMERAERLKDYYFGQDGMLIGIRKELESSSAAMEDILGGDWSTSNLGKFVEEINSSNFEELTSTINNLLNTTDSNLSDVTDSLKTLLGDSDIIGTVGYAINKLSDSLKSESQLSEERTELISAINAAVDLLPQLYNQMMELKDSLDGVADAYSSYVNNSANEVNVTDKTVADATVAIKDLKTSTDDLIAAYGEGISIHITSDGSYTLSTDIDSN